MFDLADEIPQTRKVVKMRFIFDHRMTEIQICNKTQSRHFIRLAPLKKKTFIHFKKTIVQILNFKPDQYNKKNIKEEVLLLSVNLA